MAAQLFYPMVSCLAQAADARTRLAGCKVRLFKSGFTPAWDVTLAELNAREADFSGYPAGGITIASWSAPSQGAGQGAFISGGVQTFVVGAGSPVNGNVCGGWYVVTSDNVLWIVGQFPADVPMQVEGQGQPVAMSVVFPGG